MSADRHAAARATTRPFRDEYPFQPNFLEVNGGQLHYLDEGPREKPALLCVHGNPSWSFLWRKVVREFSSTHRCVALDHIGCGLSDKPQDWPYRLEDHIANLERLVQHLDLSDITLCVHDWGGPIGLGFALRHPERVQRLVITNTAAFLSRKIPFRISLCRTPALGSFLVRRFNAFAGLAVSMAVEKPLTPAVVQGFLAPYDTFENRIATWAFVKDIPLEEDHPSYATLRAIDERLHTLRGLPTCILWGRRDFCFSDHFLELWRERFPEARVHGFSDAGHYVLEDTGAEALGLLRSFFEDHPLETSLAPSP